VKWSQELKEETSREIRSNIFMLKSKGSTGRRAIDLYTSVAQTVRVAGDAQSQCSMAIEAIVGLNHNGALAAASAAFN